MLKIYVLFISVLLRNYIAGDTVTTTAPEPACSYSANFTGPTCEEYYQCVPFLWWWQPVLLTCPEGLTFDSVSAQCIHSGLVNCQPTTTPAPTTAALITAPPCEGWANYTGPTCTQYYECYAYLWWYQPILQTCPTGQTFNATVAMCVVSNLVNCKPPTTLAPTTTAAPTTTTAPIVNPPTCTGAANYTASNCHQYYACVNWLWFFWKPQLMTCPPSDGFDPVSKTCVPTQNVNCYYPIPTPTCYDPDIYLAEECYQYYQCVQFLWWWTPSLQTCPTGESFNPLTSECVSTGTTCSGAP